MISQWKQRLRQYRSVPLFLMILIIILAPPLREGESLNNLIVICVVTVFLGVFSFYLKASRVYLIPFSILSGLIIVNIVCQIAKAGEPTRFDLEELLYIKLTSDEFLTTCVLIHHAFFAHDSSSFDRICSALTGYLMLVLLWAGFYNLVILENPAALIDTVKNTVPQGADLMYYSMITLTTQGYGDILPVSTTARILAGTQGIVGNLFLAIIIASLIGKIEIKLKKD